MTTFETTGKENTATAAAIAVEKARELNCPIVLSSSSGHSAEVILEQADKLGYDGRIVVVRSAANAALKGVNKMAPEVMRSLTDRGCTVVTAAHALSAGERSLSTRLQGVYPLEIMAHTLRMFGQGTKVCVECATMAIDAGVIPFHAPVVTLGGTGGGLDTAIILTPSYSSSILDTKIHEILCKPALIG